MKIAIKILISVVILWWLFLDFRVEPLTDVISQTIQNERFCIRGSIALLCLSILLLIGITDTVSEIIKWSIIGVCVSEAVYALLQLYGFEFSRHALYKETGTFYNPGPLGGFLAIGLVLSTHITLKISNERISKIINSNIVKYIILFIFLIVLPSTMSRTAWIAAAIGAMYVIASTNNWRRWLPTIRWQRIALLSGTILLIISILIGVWYIKKDSANGRLFLWKISALAALESPWTGHTTFAEAYSLAQEEYFRNNDAENTDILNENSIIAKYKDIAGSPDYAFNEYLNIAIEWGIPIALLFVALLILSVIVGHKRKRYGLVGGLISFMVFAFASYPMHIPVFNAVLISLIIGCLWPEQTTSRWQHFAISAALISISVIMIQSYPQYASQSEALRKWGNTQSLYSMRMYKDVVRQDSMLYEDMLWNNRFLYEYGHSLHNISRYEKSNIILNEALKRTCDPMVLNILGKNYQELGQYETAEKYFLRSTYRIPGRIYPHYLLFLLYSKTEFFDETKCRREADIILNQEIKVESSATREMREKVTEWINKRDSIR